MTSHLIALQTRLADERNFLISAKAAGERQLRTVWIAQIEKEIAAEKRFLGMEDVACDMSDADLLAELAA